MTLPGEERRKKADRRVAHDGEAMLMRYRKLGRPNDFGRGTDRRVSPSELAGYYRDAQLLDWFDKHPNQVEYYESNMVDEGGGWACYLADGRFHPCKSLREALIAAISAQGEKK